MKRSICPKCFYKYDPINGAEKCDGCFRHKRLVDNFLKHPAIDAYEEELEQKEKSRGNGSIPQG